MFVRGSEEEEPNDADASTARRTRRRSPSQASLSGQVVTADYDDVVSVRLEESGDVVKRNPSEIFLVAESNPSNLRSRGNGTSSGRNSDNNSSGSREDDSHSTEDEHNRDSEEDDDSDLTGRAVSIVSGDYSGCYGFVEKSLGDKTFEVSVINTKASSPIGQTIENFHRGQLQLSDSHAAFSKIFSAHGSNSGSSSEASTSSSLNNQSKSNSHNLTKVDMPATLAVAVQHSGITKIDPLAVGHQLKLIDLREFHQSDHSVPSEQEANEQWSQLSNRERRLVDRHLKELLPKELWPTKSATQMASDSQKRTMEQKDHSINKRKDIKQRKNKKRTKHTDKSQDAQSEVDGLEDMEEEEITTDDLGLEIVDGDIPQPEKEGESDFVTAALDLGMGATSQSHVRIRDLLSMCIDWSKMLNTVPPEPSHRYSRRSTRRATRNSSQHQAPSKAKEEENTTDEDQDVDSVNNHPRASSEEQLGRQTRTTSDASKASEKNLEIKRPEGPMRRSARGGSTPGALSESMLAKQIYSAENEDSNAGNEGANESSAAPSRSKSENDTPSASKAGNSERGLKPGKPAIKAKEAQGKGKETASHPVRNKPQAMKKEQQKTTDNDEKRDLPIKSCKSAHSESSDEHTHIGPIISTPPEFRMPVHTINTNAPLWNTEVRSRDLGDGIRSSLRRELKCQRKTHWSHSDTYGSEVVEWAHKHGAGDLPLSVISRLYENSTSADNDDQDNRRLLLHPELIARSMQGLSTVSCGGTSIRRVAEQYRCPGVDSLHELAAHLGVSLPQSVHAYAALESEESKSRRNNGLRSGLSDVREGEETVPEGDEDDASPPVEEEGEPQDVRKRVRALGSGGKRTLERFAYYTVYCEWAKSRNVTPLAFGNWYYALDVKDRLRVQINRLRERQAWDQRAYLTEFDSNLDISFGDAYSEILFQRGFSSLAKSISSQMLDTFVVEDLLNLDGLSQVSNHVGKSTNAQVSYKSESGRPILYYQLGDDQLQALNELCCQRANAHYMEGGCHSHSGSTPKLESIPWYMFQRYLFRRSLLCSSVAPISSTIQYNNSKQGKEEASVISPYLGAETDSDSEDDTEQRCSASLGLHSLRNHDVSRRSVVRKQEGIKVAANTVWPGKAADIDYFYACHVCGREKETQTEYCWNPDCYLSPVYEIKVDNHKGGLRNTTYVLDERIIDPEHLTDRAPLKWVKNVLQNMQRQSSQVKSRLYYNLLRGASKNSKRKRKRVEDEPKITESHSDKDAKNIDFPSVAPKWRKGEVRKRIVPLEQEVAQDWKFRDQYGEEYAFAYAHSFGMPQRSDDQGKLRRNRTCTDGKSMPYAQDFAVGLKEIGSQAKAREYIRATRNALGIPVSRLSGEQSASVADAYLQRARRFATQRGVAAVESPSIGGLGDSTTATAEARRKSGCCSLTDGEKHCRRVFSELLEENERLQQAGLVKSGNSGNNFTDTYAFGPAKSEDGICVGGRSCEVNSRTILENELADRFNDTVDQLVRTTTEDSMNDYFHNRSNIMKSLVEEHLDQDAAKIVWDRLFDKGVLNQNPLATVPNNLDSTTVQQPGSCSVGDREALCDMIASARHVQFADTSPNSPLAILLGFECKIYAGLFNILNSSYFGWLEDACVTRIEETMAGSVQREDENSLAAEVIQKFSSALRDQALVNCSQRTSIAMYGDLSDFMDDCIKDEPSLTVPRQLQKWSREVCKNIEEVVECENVESVSSAIHCIIEGIAAVLLLVAYLSQMISKKNSSRSLTTSGATRKQNIQVTDLINEMSSDSKLELVRRMLTGCKGCQYLHNRSIESIRRSGARGLVDFSPLIGRTVDESEKPSRLFSATVSYAQTTADSMLPLSSSASAREAQTQNGFEDQPSDESWSYYTFSAPVKVVGLKRGRDDPYKSKENVCGPTSIDLALLYDDEYNHAAVSSSAKRARVLQPHGGLPNYPTKGLLPADTVSGFAKNNAESSHALRYRYDSMPPFEVEKRGQKDDDEKIGGDDDLPQAWKQLMQFRQSRIDAQTLSSLRPRMAKLRADNCFSSLDLLADTACSPDGNE